MHTDGCIQTGVLAKLVVAWVSYRVAVLVLPLPAVPVSVSWRFSNDICGIRIAVLPAPQMVGDEEDIPSHLTKAAVPSVATLSATSADYTRSNNACRVGRHQVSYLDEGVARNQSPFHQVQTYSGGLHHWPRMICDGGGPEPEPGGVGVAAAAAAEHERPCERHPSKIDPPACTSAQTVAER